MTEQQQPKVKAQALSQVPKPARTPATKLSEQNNPKGFKGILPKASEGGIKPRVASGQRNNWVKQSARGSDEEESKLPQLTPSVQSVKAPTIAPRKALEKNSNKKLIKNALTLLVLAGQNEQTKREREEILEVIDDSSFFQYVILFKGTTGRFDFRALYARNAQDDPLTKIYGPNIAPQVIEDSQIEKFFKYSSGQRNFNEIGG